MLTRSLEESDKVIFRPPLDSQYSKSSPFSSNKLSNHILSSNGNALSVIWKHLIGDYIHLGCYSSHLSGKTASYFVIHGLNLTPHILYKCRSTKEGKLNNMHRSMKVMSTVTRVLTSWTDHDIRKWTTSSPFYPQPASQLNSVIISLVQKLKASFLKNVSLVGRSEPSHQLLLTDLKILGYISTDSLGSKCVPSCPVTQTNS